MAADFKTWLQQKGLERHADLLIEQEIDLSVLPDLSDAELIELGLPLGARKKLLRAAASLREQPGLAEAPATTVTGTPQAERRQLTVMFVDLVDSMVLSSKLDPEDMHTILTKYQSAVAGVITRYDGFVAKYMGDGVLAYFGWPSAHEDEAERAVRAGLEITQTVAKLITPGNQPLSCRIGIATGLVIVGDMIGEGAAQEQAVVGDTPNLAARMQALARPDQIVIAESTKKLLGGRFDLSDECVRIIKGIDGAVTCFEVARERTVTDRFEARSRRLLPMVGRDHELGILIDHWSRAKASEGQAILLLGEAGIGKSRIARALMDSIAEEPHALIRYQCSPYHTDSMLWPVTRQLNAAADIAVNDLPSVRLDKLSALLTDSEMDADTVPLIANLMDMETCETGAHIEPQTKAERLRLLQILADHLIGGTRGQPVLVIVEDAHWIDPTTLELIELALDGLRGARALVLVTSRLEGPASFTGHPHVNRLTLNRLGRAGVEAIVAKLGGEALSPETISAISERGDGVPLFVEELTNTVIETGAAAIRHPWHDSLMARLDRLPDAKEIAQTAACIGREFDYPLLAAIADRPEDQIGNGLDKLENAELIFRRGAIPNARYSFKHALIRDAAYQSLLKTQRRQIHARIGDYLETHTESADYRRPEILALHFAKAKQADRAISYYRQSAERAQQSSAEIEAVSHYENALEQMRSLPEGADRA